MVRVLTLVAGLIIALPASAGEMTASEASIQSRGAGLMRYGTMPLGTLRVEGQRVCASLPGAAIQPCFYLERTTAESFRGSIAGLGLCLFSHGRARCRRTDERIMRLLPSFIRVSQSSQSGLAAGAAQITKDSL